MVFLLQDCWISYFLDGLVFKDLVWFFWIQCDHPVNQLLIQKYTSKAVCTIAVLPYFEFMVFTYQVVKRSLNNLEVYEE